MYKQYLIKTFAKDGQLERKRYYVTEEKAVENFNRLRETSNDRYKKLELIYMPKRQILSAAYF